MKTFLHTTLVGCCIISSAIADNPQEKTGHKIVDKILARVNGANILQSDLEQPRISTQEGRPFTLQEAIMEELMVQHATDQHLVPTTLDIDRQITSMKIQNNLQDITEKEFEEQLRQGGLTLRMYKQQIGRKIAVDKVKQSEIHERIVISSQEVEAYCKEHPEYVKEAFHLQICSLNKDELEKSKEDKTMEWETIDWINKEDLSQDLACVQNMKKGDISAPIQLRGSDDKVQLIKLLEKRERKLKTVNQRYAQVSHVLETNKQTELLHQLEAELKTRATIVYF